MLRARRRLGEARARPHARPQLLEPPRARADGPRRLHRGPDRDARDARPDPRGDRPVSALGRPQVPRFGHGSRVPGWDEEVNLDKDPALVPDPETTPVPDELREQI